MITETRNAKLVREQQACLVTVAMLDYSRYEPIDWALYKVWLANLDRAIDIDQDLRDSGYRSRPIIKPPLNGLRFERGF
jgi:hypothetical protein